MTWAGHLLWGITLPRILDLNYEDYACCDPTRVHFGLGLIDKPFGFGLLGLEFGADLFTAAIPLSYGLR
jgi:hypothetical protein